MNWPRIFWGAKVDRSNAKSIQLSEGGFRRKVDVVPPHWFDSVDYQKYQDDVFRGVGVVNKHTKESLHNYPFLFRHRIEQKGKETNDGAKMAIRLLKILVLTVKKIYRSAAMTLPAWFSTALRI